MKILKRIVLWGLVGVVALLLARNFIIRVGAKHIVHRVLGVEMDIDDVDVGLFKSFIRIEGLKVHNPEGFGKEPLADVPLIHVDYELGSLFSGKPHCTLVELEIRDVQAVQNAAGDWNLMKIKALAEGEKKEDKEKEEKKPEAPSKKLEMQIDKLVLTLGQATYTELDKSGAVDSQKVIKIGLDHDVTEDLKSPEEIAQIVGWKVAKAGGLNLAMAWIRESLKEKLTSGLKSIGNGITDSITKGAKGLFSKLNPFSKDKKKD